MEDTIPFYFLIYPFYFLTYHSSEITDVRYRKGTKKGLVLYSEKDRFGNTKGQVSLSPERTGILSFLFIYPFMSLFIIRLKKRQRGHRCRIAPSFHRYDACSTESSGVIIMDKIRISKKKVTGVIRVELRLPFTDMTHAAVIVVD